MPRHFAREVGTILALQLWTALLVVFVITVTTVRASRRPWVVWAVIVISSYPLVDIALRQERGWDLNVICGAWQAMRAGADPYVMAQLQQFTHDDLPLPYPAFWVAVLQPLCLAPGAANLLVQGVLLAAAYLIAPRRRRLDGVLIALLVGGFGGFAWNLLTGNFGAIELVLLAGVFACAVRGRLVAAGALLGVLGSFKLLPTLYLLALLAWWRRGRRREVLGAIGAGVAVVVAVQVITWAMEPDLYPSFLRRITGGYHDTPFSMLERDYDYTSPTPWRSIAGFPDGHRQTVKAVVLVAAFLAALAVPTVRFGRRLAARPPACDPLPAFSWALIVLALISLRLKPYSFVHLVLPVAWLMRGLAPGRQLAVLLLATLLPAWHFVVAPEPDLIGTLNHLRNSMQAFVAIAVAMICGYGWSAQRDSGR